MAQPFDTQGGGGGAGGGGGGTSGGGGGGGFFGTPPGPRPGTMAPPTRPGPPAGGRPAAPPPSPIAVPNPFAPAQPPAESTKTPMRPAGGPPSATGQPAAPMAPPQTMLTRVPTTEEFAALQGQQIMTPWGPVIGDEAGRPKLVLDENGRAAYQQAKVSTLQRYGAIPGWAQTPGAQPPPVEVGRANFNPFTGQWTGVDDDLDSRVL